ncbi:MAG: hypothetical protein WAO35_18150, partial [Terriglobia bacterium]
LASGSSPTPAASPQTQARQNPFLQRHIIKMGDKFTASLCGLRLLVDEEETRTAKAAVRATRGWPAAKPFKPCLPQLKTLFTDYPVYHLTICTQDGRTILPIPMGKEELRNQENRPASHILERRETHPTPCVPR